MKADQIRIGTMGFSYKDWLENFYPAKTQPKNYLAHYVTQFNSIEIDSTFYRIPARSTVSKWAETAPDQFTFSAKFPQTVTHDGTIETRVEQARLFVDLMLEMGEKLGVLLLQFPYSFKPDRQSMLTELLDEIPAGFKLAVELRNRNWLNDKLFADLENRGIGLCLVDHPWVPKLRVKTAEHVYIRMLGDIKQIEDDFSHERFERKEELAWWAEAVAELGQMGGEIFTYFNNHFSGHSPTTARRFSSMVSSKA